MATRPRSPSSSRADRTRAEPDPTPAESDPTPPASEHETTAGPGPMTSEEFARLRRILRRKYH